MEKLKKQLIVMCGIPGSGKSSWIKNHKNSFKNSVKVVSRDEIRFSLVSEDEEYFSKENEVFNKFIKEIKDGLINNDVVFADATHINEASRSKLLRSLGNLLKDVKVIAIVIKPSLEVTFAQNAQREERKLVPRGQVRRMYYQFTKPTLEEGFDEIWTYKNFKYEIEKRRLINMGKIWLCSDLHLGHNKPFIWQARGFNSIEEHDQAIIKNWNELVSWDDEVWLLGDCMLNDNEGGIRKLNQLAGKIYILAGNHDSTNRIQLYANIRPTILTMGLAYILKYQGYHFYLSHYPVLCSNYDDDKPLKRQMISIAGHKHTTNKFCDMDKGIIYHVELDCQGNKPVLLDDIIEDIKKYKGVK